MNHYNIMVRKKNSIHDARKMTNKSVNSLIHFTREQNFCPIYYVVGIKKKKQSMDIVLRIAYP